MSDRECIFCDIFEGRAPADVVFEDEETLAFMDIHPFHMHIIPRWYGDGLRLARPPEMRRAMSIKEAAARISREVAKDAS